LCFAILCAAAPPGKLAIQHFAVHQFEDGPEMAPTHEFLPGETVYITCRISGFQPPTKEDEHVKLEWSLAAADPAGVPFDKPKSGHIDAQVLPQDKNWVPKFVESVSIPPFAASGEYKLTVKVLENTTGNEATGELKIPVRGRDVEPSATLVARNFHFYHGEQDRAPMREAVYHSGEMLWARFDITGFKLGPGNHFDVEYGLAVEREGKQVFAQPAAASESKESFYPQRYVPGALSLSVDPAVPKGPYMLVVIIHDKVADLNYEVKEAFRVE
jgi:hypothetical protein